MARMRPCIAVDLGKVVRDRCIALQETLARAGTDVKWVEEQNLHLTLLFLGEVVDRDTPALCRAVADCCAQHPPFTLSVETVGCFPNPRRPRVVWAGVGAGHADLCALHDDLESPLLELGCYRREERQYTPHITLGRAQGERPREKIVPALGRQAAWSAGETDVREVCVLSSELRSGGPTYTLLSRARLTSSESGHVGS